MKRIILFSLCLLTFSLQTIWGQKRGLTETRNVIERVTGKSDLPISLALKPGKGKLEGKTAFKYRVDHGVLREVVLWLCAADSTIL